MFVLRPLHFFMSLSEELKPIANFSTKEGSGCVAERSGVVLRVASKSIWLMSFFYGGIKNKRYTYQKPFSFLRFTHD